ncbi:MAG TPA: hypothetical protein ENJ82_03890 [Bacteroidetes bacterium]|nr:hypothetical protein [Bacteroidota bacterium]
MRFRSEIELPISSWQFDQQSHLLLLGSCFADTMGSRLLKYKFSALVNPFGILYHPISLLRPLRAALSGENPFQDNLFESEGQWHSFHFHSQLCATSELALQQKIQATLATTKEALLKAKVLVLTFGTAIAFRHLASDTLVANCHKVPAQEFSREMLPLEMLFSETSAFLQQLWEQNPRLQILLTVSPIRHLRSGIIENSASKAILRTLCQQLITQFEQASYFPAYELMLDDLRDYRFYREDLAHPTEMAQQYIWEKFRDSYVQTAAIKHINLLKQIQKDLAHRPRNPNSKKQQQFLLALKEKIAHLQPVCDLSQEWAEVQNRLSGL